jgi:hypothetical protein
VATRSDALGAVQSVLEKIRAYVQEHDTFDDIAELNRKYVPNALQDEITWLSEMAERLLHANPDEPDHDNAVAAPERPPT